MRDIKIGFIGSGKMASAILGGVCQNNFLNPEKIILGGGLIESVDYFYNKTIK